MTIKKVWDTPLWLPTAQFRTATSATSSMTVSKDTLGRYIYYLAGTLFYKYDTWKDTHIKLASPPIAAVTASCIKFTADDGYRGNCLSGGTNVMKIAGLNGDILVGETIKIMQGKGVGQERTITNSTGVKVEKSGIVTSASATSIGDTTKKWEINQWIGYQVRIVANTGLSQIRKVLYNDASTLYFQDPNYQQLEVWNNTAFSATAPYALPASTAGSQSNYYIESSIITVDSDWTVVPDASSSYVVKGGGVYMLSAVAGAPFSSLQFYDVLSDTWTTKTAIGGLLLAALGTDFSMEIITRATPYESGTSTSTTTRTLTDTSKTLEIDRYCNYELRITSGTGMGMKNRIVSNGVNYYEVEHPFLVQPDATSTYEIRGETKKIYVVGNNASSIYQYCIDFDQWITGPSIDLGQTRNASISYPGQEAQAIFSGVINPNGIKVLNPTPTVKGSGYAVGDLFNITTVGTVGKGRVESISTGGAVESVSLYSAGLNYTTGSGKATTIISGGGNNALTVNITTVGTVARMTTVSNVNFYKGDTVTVAGCNESAWNAPYSILAIDSLTTFDLVTTATLTIVPSFVNSVVLIVDSTKNWVVNEHVGKIVKLDVAGTSPTTQLRRITSNTATTLTVATIVAGVNGTSRYAIHGPEGFGRDRMYDLISENGEGHAASGTSVTLTDTSKNWQVNQFLGYKVRIIAGTGVGSEIAISANDASTLTLTTPGFTPDSTTKYAVMGAHGTANGTFALTTLGDTTKNWTVNKWAGKRVVFTSGTGQRQESTIASNTATVLTFGAVGVAPDATTTYTILGESTRATATSLRWLYGTTHDKGRWLISPRGGNTNTIDRYDIVNDIWDISMIFSPQSEIFSAGTSYCYDGLDTYYASIAVAGDFVYILSINLLTMELNGAFQTTVLQGTAHIGNLMEVVTSPDGGKFLFLGVDTSRLMYKTAIF